MSHRRLERVVAAIPPDRMEAEGVVGEWSPKVTLAHITWWEQVSVHVVRDEPEDDPLEGEEWNTDRANARLFARNRVRPVEEILAAFRASYADLLTTLQALPAARLNVASPYDGTLYELIAGNTFAHYDEHADLLAAAFGVALPPANEASAGA